MSRRRGSGVRSEALVDRAIRGGFGESMRIAPRLRRLPPCEASALRLAIAFREQRLSHFETALLLGAVGHPMGFEVVCELFADHRLSYAGGYLANALLELDPHRAPARLVDFVEHAASRPGRDEAVWGLARLDRRTGHDALMRASASGRVTPEVAAPVLVGRGIEPDIVERWLESGVRSEADVACIVVAIAAWCSTDGSRACKWLAGDRERLLRLAQDVVTRGQATPKPYVRTGLRRPTRHPLLRPSISNTRASQNAERSTER
jgi:hypothetical protein